VCDTASRHGLGDPLILPNIQLDRLIPRCIHLSRVPSPTLQASGLSPSSLVQTSFPRLQYIAMLTINALNMEERVWVEGSGVCEGE
jgi:hypothetical protein